MNNWNNITWNKPQQRILPGLIAAAALALVIFGYFLHGSGSTPALLPAMGVFHIVAFKLADPANLPTLNSRMLALKDECKINGASYIRSATGGKQSSPEGKDRGMQVVFLVEFETQEHADYYIHKDPAHNAFKDSIASLGVEDVTVLDFVPGVF